MKKVPLTRQDSTGLLCIQNPPVNALSPQVISVLRGSCEEFRSDSALKTLLCCFDGTTFVAGGDISSFGDPGFFWLGAERWRDCSGLTSAVAALVRQAEGGCS